MIILQKEQNRRVCIIHPFPSPHRLFFRSLRRVDSRLFVSLSFLSKVCAYTIGLILLKNGKLTYSIVVVVDPFQTPSSLTERAPLRGFCFYPTTFIPTATFFPTYSPSLLIQHGQVRHHPRFSCDLLVSGIGR